MYVSMFVTATFLTNNFTKDFIKAPPSPADVGASLKALGRDAELLTAVLTFSANKCLFFFICWFVIFCSAPLCRYLSLTHRHRG